jgi:hypothetical protein
MPVSIENRTDTRVLLRLNSGQNWYLGPGEALDVEPVEVKGNAWLQRLEERRLIVLDRGEGGGEGGEGGEEQPADAQPGQPVAAGEPPVEGRGALSAEAAVPVAAEDEPPTSPRPRRIRTERESE